MLKNKKSGNRNQHQNPKTEVFCHKNRKTDLKIEPKPQNRKSQCPVPNSGAINKIYERVDQGPTLIIFMFALISLVP